MHSGPTLAYLSPMPTGTLRKFHPLLFIYHRNRSSVTRPRLQYSCGLCMADMNILLTVTAINIPLSKNNPLWRFFMPSLIRRRERWSMACAFLWACAPCPCVLCSLRTTVLYHIGKEMQISLTNGKHAIYGGWGYQKPQNVVIFRPGSIGGLLTYWLKNHITTSHNNPISK